jgi:X-linked retinitis pigmentosa GTPase regulator
MSVQQIAAGSEHSLFLNDRGEVYATGCNQKLQLGITDMVVNSTSTPVKVQSLAKFRVAKIDAKGYSAAVTASGDLYMWGVGVFGTVKVPQKVTQISNQVQDICLGFSTLGAAIDISGRLWTWGSNIAGELGIGDNEPKVNPYPVLSLKKKTVT